jgi:hypothetical protein
LIDFSFGVARREEIDGGLKGLEMKSCLTSRESSPFLGFPASLDFLVAAESPALSHCSLGKQLEKNLESCDVGSEMRSIVNSSSNEIAPLTLPVGEVMLSDKLSNFFLKRNVNRSILATNIEKPYEIWLI